jgi:hypothetical protein
MAIDPRSVDDVYSDLKDEISGRIAKLTSFIPGSFNDVWVDAFAGEIHDIEAKVLAAQLSGWASYAGAEVDETDLERLGVDGVSTEEVNQYMEDSHLDQLATIVGIEREDGQNATGSATIQTATDDTRVPEGMEVSTPGVAGEQQLVFLVDADGDGSIGSSGFTTPDPGNTEVTVDIIAEEIGEEYNVGPGSITRMPDPPIGVEGVTNAQPTTGGKDIQSTESFRQDVQNAVFESSGGGTALGIEGFIEDEVGGVADVELDEFVDNSPPFVDVIVDGGSEQDVLDAISTSRPAGIEHNLVRPEVISIGVRTQISGSDIDTSFVNTQINSYLLDIALGGEYRRSKLIQTIMNSDTDIDDMASLTTLLRSVTGESHVQDTADTYELEFNPVGSVDDDQRLYQDGKDVYTCSYEQIDDSTVVVSGILDGNEHEFVRGTDYTVVDDDGDGNLDSIEFQNVDVPDSDTVFEIEYVHDSWTIDSEITDQSDNTYNQGTDWQVVDTTGDGFEDSIDWSIGGSEPAEGERWFVDYSPKRTVSVDLDASKREKLTAGSTISVEVV